MYMMRIGRKRNIIRYGLLGGLASEILGCPLSPFLLHWLSLRLMFWGWELSLDMHCLHVKGKLLLLPLSIRECGTRAVTRK